MLHVERRKSMVMPHRNTGDEQVKSPYAVGETIGSISIEGLLKIIGRGIEDRELEKKSLPCDILACLGFHLEAPMQ